MSFPFTPNPQTEKLESLQTQHEYLKLLRLRHLQWLTSADQSETEAVHQKIAELLELTGDYYNRLLRESQRQGGRAR